MITQVPWKDGHTSIGEAISYPGPTYKKLKKIFCIINSVN